MRKGLPAVAGFKPPPARSPLEDLRRIIQVTALSRAADFHAVVALGTIAEAARELERWFNSSYAITKYLMSSTYLHPEMNRDGMTPRQM